jgi:putative transposase
MSVSNILGVIKQQFRSLPGPDKRTKASPNEFIGALVASVTKDGRVRTLANLRRSVIALTGITMDRKTFWERLAAERLCTLLTWLATALMKELGRHLGVTDELLATLQVKAIFVLDSTSSTLPKKAKDVFPAPRKNVIPAAIKVHCLFNLLGGTMKWFDLTEAKKHDRKGFPPLDLLKGCLIVFDLGYWDYCLLAALANQGTFFLSRVKSNAVITVREVVCGLPKYRFEGRTLFDRKFPKRKRKLIEVIGEFHHYGKQVLTARVIGFWNPVERQYHWYVTNLGLAARLIYPLYRLRWQLELVFKACKSSLCLADQTSANENIIRSLTLTSLVAKLIGFALGKGAIATMDKHKQTAFSFQRAAMLMNHVGRSFFLFLTIAGRKIRDRLLQELHSLSAELFDPNHRHRESSLQRFYRLANAAP